ncbi:MAG: rod-binding protein [Gemmatimonadales bacterium]
MTDIRIGAPGIAGTGPRSADERLRAAAKDFEGVFLTQLFKEMRATVPTEDESQGQEMFTAMLDETLAREAAARSERGLGDALYRQLATRLTPNISETGTGHGDGSR